MLSTKKTFESGKQNWICKIKFERDPEFETSTGNFKEDKINKNRYPLEVAMVTKSLNTVTEIPSQETHR